jgi:hypothetical protein
MVNLDAALNQQHLDVSVAEPIARGRPSGEVPLAWSSSRQPSPEPEVIFPIVQFSGDYSVLGVTVGRR